MDFDGPLDIRGKTADEVKKTYIALFVCCTTLACHLELVPGLSADTFCVYVDLWQGVPKLINSDNMKTFKTFNSIIQKLTSSPKLQTFFTKLPFFRSMSSIR